MNLEKIRPQGQASFMYPSVDQQIPHRGDSDPADPFNFVDPGLEFWGQYINYRFSLLFFQVFGASISGQAIQLGHKTHITQRTTYLFMLADLEI